MAGDGVEPAGGGRSRHFVEVGSGKRSDGFRQKVGFYLIRCGKFIRYQPITSLWRNVSGGPKVCLAQTLARSRRFGRF